MSVLLPFKDIWRHWKETTKYLLLVSEIEGHWQVKNTRFFVILKTCWRLYINGSRLPGSDQRRISPLCYDLELDLHAISLLFHAVQCHQTVRQKRPVINLLTIPDRYVWLEINWRLSFACTVLRQPPTCHTVCHLNTRRPIYCLTIRLFCWHGVSTFNRVWTEFT